MGNGSFCFLFFHSESDVKWKHALFAWFQAIRWCSLWMVICEQCYSSVSFAPKFFFSGCPSLILNKNHNEIIWRDPKSNFHFFRKIRHFFMQFYSFVAWFLRYFFTHIIWTHISFHTHFLIWFLKIQRCTICWLSKFADLESLSYSRLLALSAEMEQLIQVRISLSNLQLIQSETKFRKKCLEIQKELNQCPLCKFWVPLGLEKHEVALFLFTIILNYPPSFGVARTFRSITTVW